ncbi:MAG: hypothetical protein SGI86_23090 [Deltaproteobacteria bacterium]|nr:hypothetical protein [Deltaproteobacteria bacterium]
MKQLWFFGLTACLCACAGDSNPKVGVGGGGISGTGTRIVVSSDVLLSGATDGGPRPPVGVGVGLADAAPADSGGQGMGGTPGMDTMAATCDLVAQNCAKELACYRRPTGGTVCEVPGFAAEVTPCAADAICSMGLVCVAGESGIAGCLPVCDPQLAPCPDRRACRPLRGYEPAGYCEL